MELEELKNNWQLLNEKLNKRDVLKEKIIREMLCTKSNKSLSKLINTEIVSLTICFLSIPFFAYLKSIENIVIPFADAFWIFMIVYCVICAVWYLYKLNILSKMDFMKDIGSNLRLINKFNIRIRQEKMTMFIVFPILSAWCIYAYAMLNANVVLWTFLACILLFGVFIGIVIYKRIYDKNIQTIQRSLDELKELDEPESVES